MMQRPFFIAYGHQADIYGQIDEGCARLLPFGIFKRKARDFGNGVGADNRIGTARNRFEHSA